MGYRIKYQWMREAQQITTAGKWFKVGMVLLFMVCAAGFLFWLSGGVWSTTVSALEGMAEDIRGGENLKDAFSTFCLEVLQGA